MAKRKKQKVYELTTNRLDGFNKYYVRGIKNDTEARKIAKLSFGRFYWKNGISYYDDYPSKYGNDWGRTPTRTKFVKRMKKIYR